MKTTFDTAILGSGNNGGIEVPPKNVAELGDSKKPPVNVILNTYTYKSTVASMDGKYMIPLSKAHRDASGLAIGDQVTVVLELDDGPRIVEVPAELQAALKKAGLDEVFEKQSYSKRKEFARQVAEAKAEDTRLRRIEKVIEALKG